MVLGSGLYRNANTVKYKECRNKCCRSKETEETWHLDDYQSRPAWALQKENAVSWEKGGATVTYTRLSHHTAIGRSGPHLPRSQEHTLHSRAEHRAQLYIHSLSPKIPRSSAHAYSQILHESMHMNEKKGRDTGGDMIRLKRLNTNNRPLWIEDVGLWPQLLPHALNWNCLQWKASGKDKH